RSQTLDGVGQLRSRWTFLSGLPSSLARDLTWFNRDQRALIGPGFFHQIEQLRPRIALDVELDARVLLAQDRGNGAHVFGRDVAATGTRVNRDARRPGRDTDPDSLEDARHAPAARVAQRGHLIDVY